jgi:hypothetical protein
MCCSNSCYRPISGLDTYEQEELLKGLMGLMRNHVMGCELPICDICKAFYSFEEDR